MAGLDAISSSGGSNDPNSDNDQISHPPSKKMKTTGDGGGGGIHQETEAKEEESKETDEEIKQDSVKGEEEAKKTDEEIDLSKEAEEKPGDGGGGIHQENEAESKEVETMRTDQLKGKGEIIVKKMLEDVQDTDIEKKARNAAYFLVQKDIEKDMEKYAEQWNLLNGIIVQNAEVLTENEKKTLRQTQDQCSLHVKVLEKLLGLSKQEEKLADAIAAEIADDQKQILQQQLSSLSSDAESARYQLHMVKKPFPKLMDETRKILGNMKRN